MADQSAAGAPGPPEALYEGLPEGASPTVHLLAGGLAGIVEHAVTFPFDSVKTRMQVIKPHPAAIYSNFVQALHRITTLEGSLRLFRGVQSVILGAGPAHGIYFSVYEAAKVRLAAPIAVGGLASRCGEGGFLFRTSEGAVLLSSHVASSVAGALATAASDAFMTPFDVVKQRMQMHGSPYRGVYDCAAHLLRTEGGGAFYRSYPTTLLLNVPFHMMQFPLYEHFAGLLRRRRGRPPGGATYDPLVHIASGGLAGAIASLATTPIDVVKTALQTRSGDVQGMRSAIVLIHRTYGAAGFVRGALPRMITHMPATALCWAVYEYFKWALHV